MSDKPQSDAPRNATDIFRAYIETKYGPNPWMIAKRDIAEGEWVTEDDFEFRPNTEPDTTTTQETQA